MIPSSICAVSNRCCIRVIKESKVVASVGVKVILFHNAKTTTDVSCFSDVKTYQDKKDFETSISQFSGVSLFHVHNEPDWMVTAIRKHFPRSTIIFDCHDLDSIRTSEVGDEEREAFINSNAYIFPSQRYLELSTKYHKIPAEKPKAVVYSMCNRESIVLNPLPRIGGLVYEGGSLSGNMQDNVRYRDYTEIVKSLTELGIPITMFSGNDGLTNRQEYINAGALFVRTYPYTDMIRNLSRFDWGVCMSEKEHTVMDTAMPNKLFEYIAAGIPVIVMNQKEVGEYVSEHGIGVVVESMKELSRIYCQSEKYRRRVHEVRNKLVMESQIRNILDIYDRACEHGRGKSQS